MLKQLFAALKNEFMTSNSSGILYNAYCILHLLEADYVKDDNARNAAIDAVCELLQSNKVVVPTTAGNSGSIGLAPVTSTTKT